MLPPYLSLQQKKKFLHDVKAYLWDDLLLFKRCPDQIIRSCVLEEEVQDIIQQFHSSFMVAILVLQELLQRYCNLVFIGHLFKDSYSFVKTCDRCQ